MGVRPGTAKEKAELRRPPRLDTEAPPTARFRRLPSVPLFPPLWRLSLTAGCTVSFSTRGSVSIGAVGVVQGSPPKPLASSLPLLGPGVLSRCVIGQCLVPAGAFHTQWACKTHDQKLTWTSGWGLVFIGKPYQNSKRSITEKSVDAHLENRAGPCRGRAVPRLRLGGRRGEPGGRHLLLSSSTVRCSLTAPHSELLASGGDWESHHSVVISSDTLRKCVTTLGAQMPLREFLRPRG